MQNGIHIECAIDCDHLGMLYGESKQHLLPMTQPPQKRLLAPKLTKNIARLYESQFLADKVRCNKILL